MEWLSVPLIILGLGVWFRGWPSFVTHKHYHYYNEKEKDEENSDILIK